MKLEEIEKMYRPSEQYIRNKALSRFVVDNIGMGVKAWRFAMDIVDMLNDHKIFSITDLQHFSLSDIKSKYNKHDERIVEICCLKEKLNYMIENDDSQ